MLKDFFGSFSLVIAFISYIPYAVMTIRHSIRPHVFSWIIWSTMNAIAFVAQETRGAGPGGWATGLSAAGCFVITFLAALHGERNITRGDLAVFLASLAAIPLWYATSNPLWAVVVLCFINVAAFYPTFRKSWARPREELLSQFLISNIKHIASLVAMSHYSLVTLLYPLTSLCLNTSLAAAVFHRRSKGATA